MNVIKTIKNYMVNHKIRVSLIIIIIIISTLIALLPAQILRIIVDDTIKNKEHEKLLLMAIVYALTYFIIGIINFIKDYAMISLSQYIILDLKCNMMKHIHKIKYNVLINTDSGSLETYFNNDVNSINELFTSGVANMVTDLFKVVGIVISIFIYNYKFGLIVLGLIPLLVLFTTIVKKRMLRAQLKTKSLEGNVNKLLLESVENIEQIKINKAHHYSKNKYHNILLNHYNAIEKSNFYDAFFSPVMQIIKNVFICAILLISGSNLSFFGMTIGMIISSISLITDLFIPIENLGMEIQTIQKSIAAIKRINQFFNLDANDDFINNKIDEFKIEFKNVTFSYDELDIINNFNLTINSRDKIVLQGASGTGKSTIMKLAMGLLKPKSGKVLVGKVDSYLLSDEIRKEDFAIVYQDPFFSNGTIYEEISLLDKSVSKETVREALNKVGLDYIKNIDITLNNNEYSSGELTLFNIARVIVKNPKIVFLDEMNAKIDPLTAKEIIRLINDITKDKMVISINHYGDILNDAKIIKL